MNAFIHASNYHEHKKKKNTTKKKEKDKEKNERAKQENGNKEKHAVVIAISKSDVSPLDRKSKTKSEKYATQSIHVNNIFFSSCS
mmetsp:Transcript_24043/g.47135  ORF Transcript_24043/g.47135 Transcript_24043/m.47135 type:complete len:85 (+) Transcript_24043:229-483(+)